MNIQDAIKQAGEGGKIKIPKWGVSATACIDIKNGRMYCGDSDTIYDIVETELLLRNDWEVVAPEIEVGDVIKTPNASRGQERIVTWMRNGCDQLQAQYSDDICNTYEVNECTLIRKGAKKIVFEEVSWHYGTNGKGQAGCIPQSIDGLRDNGLGALIDNDKTYTMTLEEE